MAQRNILITGTHETRGRQVAELLADAGYRTHAVDGGPGVPPGRIPPATHRRHHVPAVGTPERVPTLLRLAKRHHIDVLLPTNRAELMELATASSLFRAAGVRVVVSDPRGLTLTDDGYYALGELAARSVPAVPATVPSDLVGSGQPAALPERRALLVPRRPWSASDGVSIFDPEGFDFATVGDGFLVCSTPGPVWTVALDIGPTQTPAIARERRGGELLTGDAHRAAVETAVRAAEALSLTGPVEMSLVGGRRGPHVLDVRPGLGAEHIGASSAFITMVT